VSDLIKYRRLTVFSDWHLDEILRIEPNFCPVKPYVVNYNLLGCSGILLTDGEYVIELEGLWKYVKLSNFEKPPKVIREGVEWYLFS
jgi:hypothetical protein